jgi:uncharacterized protein (TIGR00375 family)
MNLGEIGRYAQIKGLSVVGTGDFTHPLWMKELKKELQPLGDTGLYVLPSCGSKLSFMITAEVCTIFDYNGKTKKVHHVVLSPSIEVAEQITDKLRKYGSLSADGRPILDLSAPEMVEQIIETSTANLIFPAHAWTPWFSVLAANAGFDSIEECYGDTSSKIHALETGLSSDPKMNWRLSKLDRYTLVSNSDSHSAWPWRMGREANVFELERPTFEGITGAIIDKDSKRLKFTIETDPAYGKYHWTGHRNCGISMSPPQAVQAKNLCPKCHRPLTKGVEQRVEELADRPPGYQPAGVPSFVHLLPLSEIIATVIGVEQPASPRVWQIYNNLVLKFGSEIRVLLDATKEELNTIVEPNLTQAIIGIREDKVVVVPGYDGVYGKIDLFATGSNDVQDPVRARTKLEEFM